MKNSAYAVAKKYMDICTKDKNIDFSFIAFK